MDGNVFVDTNVLVYARDLSYPDKQRSAERWLKRLWRSGTGRTGIQVLNEYFVTVTNKLSPGLLPDAAWKDVNDLLAWEPRAVDRSCVELARHVSVRHSLSWWDCLIVAAAQLEGCTTLLTEDLQDGQLFDGLHVRNPFTNAAAPG